jgi:hypothetical protein
MIIETNLDSSVITINVNSLNLAVERSSQTRLISQNPVLCLFTGVTKKT